MKKRGMSKSIRLFFILIFLVLLSWYFLSNKSTEVQDSISIEKNIQSATENVKTYNEKNKEVIITKDDGNELARLILISPLNNNVIRGKDRLVAEFEIKSFEDYNAFNNLEFYDINQGLKKFDRNYKYKYKVFYEANKPIFSEVCETKDTENGTENYNCKLKEVGEEKVINHKWEDFNYKTKLKKGDIIIGIFTDVLPEDNVEWVPTLFDVKIEEWAVWQDSWSIGLFSYFNGSSNINSINTHYNLNDSQASFYQTVNSHSNLGGYLNFTGNEVLQVDNTGNTSNQFGFIDNSNQGTVCFWARPTISESVRFITKSNDENGMKFQTVNTARWVMQANWGDVNLENDQPIILNNWQFVCGFRNATHNGIYVNGSLDGYRINPTHTQVTNSVIFGGQTGDTWYHGSLDEIGFWNRSLSAQEISDIYNNHNGISFDNKLANLSITDPTTSNPKSVNEGNNITITFDFLKGGVNITSGVTINNITIGGIQANNSAIWYNNKWNVNITVPNDLTGSQNLFVNATDGSEAVDTEINAINYVSGATCICPSINTNWNISMADNCIISSACNIGSGNISFYDNGNFTCSANINASNFISPGDNNNLYINSNCKLNIG